MIWKRKAYKGVLRYETDNGYAIVPLIGNDNAGRKVILNHALYAQDTYVLSREDVNELKAYARGMQYLKTERTGS